MHNAKVRVRTTNNARDRVTTPVAKKDATEPLRVRSANNAKVRVGSTHHAIVNLYHCNATT